MSLLPVIAVCDNFRLENSSEPLLVPLLLHAPNEAEKQFPLGYLRPQIVDLLRADKNNIWKFTESLSSNSSSSIVFPDALDTPPKRTAAVGTLVQKWIDQGLFLDITGGRLTRHELYAVYVNPFGPLNDSNLAFAIERSAAALFGVVTYGAHMTMWFDDPTEGCKIWIPTRSSTKQTWPGYLDNSVAGGIPWGLSPTECIVKEAAEEASLNEAEVRKHVKSRGCVSYFAKTSKGYLQPEIQFVFDLQLPSDSESALKPEPSDGEVQSFELCALADCVDKMRQGRFKPNCALDFMIRQGYLTPENEENYFEIVTRLHGRYGFRRVH